MSRGEAVERIPMATASLRIPFTYRYGNVGWRSKPYIEKRKETDGDEERERERARENTEGRKERERKTGKNRERCMR